MCEIGPSNRPISQDLTRLTARRKTAPCYAVLMTEGKGLVRRQYKVSLSPAEKAAIEEHARATSRSFSGLLRDLALSFEPKSTLDQQAVLALVKINADQGRLGGLLKLWLTERPGQGASTADVRRLLQQIEEAQAELRRLVRRL